MNTFYFQYNDQGHVASYSENSQGTDVLSEIQLPVDDLTYALIQQNYDLYIQDNQLVCVKPQRIIDEEKQAQIDALKGKLIEGTATNNDIQTILLNLIS
jgi:hypothetical protein